MRSSAPPKHELWVDKYKPRTVADMCYPASANHLKQWLQAFDAKNPKLPHGALLSGPPGIGKTTSVHLVAGELGFDIIEFNASDHRSRKSLRDAVTAVVDNRVFGNKTANHNSGSKFVLLMDEVDGCDLGGVSEVIEMIKKTKIPIVCSCNDRWHQKLRSLVNHVEDIRFRRPPCNIVANYICERVLAREGVSLPRELLQDIIQREGSDIRGVIGNLQLWCLQHKVLDAGTLARCAKTSAKNSDVGIFDAAETFLFTHNPKKTFEQLQSAFYSADLVDMFVQENYLHFRPDGRPWMDAVAEAAASIAQADLVHRAIYSEQNWSLSNMHVLTSAIRPSALVRGKYESFVTGPQAHFDRSRPIKFPAWLGNNSSANKNIRLLSCVATEAGNPTTQLSGTRDDVVLDYIPLMLAPALTQPLAVHEKDGVPAVISVMDQYRLQRDDWDFMQDVISFKKMASRSACPSYGSAISTQAKSAFTREFNKTHKLESFAKNIKFSAPSSGDGAETQAADDEEEDGGGGGGAAAAAPKVSAKKAPPAKPSGKRGSKAPAKQAGAKRSRASGE